MTDKPILFSGAMVRAILAGQKTQTRRVLKPQPETLFNTDGEFGQRTGWLWNSGGAGPDGCWHSMDTLPRPYTPGDRLYVREAFTRTQFGKAVYRADATDADGQRWTSIVPGDPDGEVLWKPSIHMPRADSRLTLTVIDVRVQRLQELTRGDAMDEGCPFPNMADGPDPRAWFAKLWDSLNAERGFGWEVNPWVCAITFDVHRLNIDQMERAA